MLELRRDGCGMKQRPETRPAQLVWPEFSQMIEWQLDGHGVLLAQRGNSRDSVVVPAVSAAFSKLALALARVYANFCSMNLTTIAIAVTNAHNFANNSPWRV
jgi:hypothetical protein